MGFVNSVLGAAAQGSAYDAQKRRVLVEGEAARNAAYAQATAKGEAGKRQLAVVAENMARAAGNRRREMGAARNAAAGSGFTDEGTGGKAEEVVGRVHGLQMADMARAGSVGGMQALNEQVALRRQGDEAMRAAVVEARQLGALAKASRTGAWFNALSGVVGMAGGAVNGVEGAQAFNADNAEAIAKGDVGAASLWKNGFWGGVLGGDGTAGFAAGVNPFTAQFAGDSWDKNFMGLLGVGKIKK